MIVILKQDATRTQMDNVIARIEQMGCGVVVSQGEERTIIGSIGNGRRLDTAHIERIEGVERTVPITRPFRSNNGPPESPPTRVQSVNKAEFSAFRIRPKRSTGNRFCSKPPG